MLYTDVELLQLLHDTHAVSIWNSSKGPVFWYAANVPGPFYVNTEKVIGAQLSEHLLREITAIVSGTIDVEARAKQLNTLILEAFKSNVSWQKLIATMAQRAHREWTAGRFSAISGGERRDWLFSIPFAYICDLPHLFLFKNQTLYCTQHLPPERTVLHVSDLINNAASFLDLWQPTLQKAGLACCGNMCLNLRGENGLKRLSEAGQKTVSLMTINRDYFHHLHAADLIDRATYEEIAIFFASAADWAARYLLGRAELFDAQGCDSKSFDRLRHFIAEDPWHLRTKHGDFFANMQKIINQRLARAA